MTGFFYFLLKQQLRSFSQFREVLQFRLFFISSLMTVLLRTFFILCYSNYLGYVFIGCSISPFQGLFLFSAKAIVLFICSLDEFCSLDYFYQFFHDSPSQDIFYFLLQQLFRLCFFACSIIVLFRAYFYFYFLLQQQILFTF